MQKLYLFTLALSAVFLGACVETKPEGPGERIGRGLDEIAAALQDIDPKKESQEEQRRRARYDREYDSYDGASDDVYQDQKPSVDYEDRSY